MTFLCCTLLQLIFFTQQNFSTNFYFSQFQWKFSLKKIKVQKVLNIFQFFSNKFPRTEFPFSRHYILEKTDNNCTAVFRALISGKFPVIVFYIFYIFYIFALKFLHFVNYSRLDEGENVIETLKFICFHYCGSWWKINTAN